MHSKAMEKIVNAIMTYSTTEQDAREIVATLSLIDWKPLFKGVVECEICGHIYDIRKNPSTWICPRCDPNKTREAEKLLYTLQKEPKSDKTLTIEVWIQILDHFNWKCAYCLEKQYVQMDHFMPRSLKGLTTIDNCVPSCPKKQ